MQVLTLLIELAEKCGLLAAAALFAVLFPPLRNRLLGVGRRQDKLAALALGLGLALWGTTLGIEVRGEHVNLRAIGVLIAAILGGPKAGGLAGLGGGLFFAVRSEPDAVPWVLVASVLDGVLAGLVAERAPRYFQGWRTFTTSMAIQTIHILVVGAGLVALGTAERYMPAWPAHLVKLIVNGAGVTLFVVVARLVVAREEARVALVEARAAADTMALDSLRRRLEPHFLFNSLNVLRATIRTDPARARELVADLADLYRYVLSHPHDATVRDEVTHACAYLAIERARLGDERLRVEVEVDPAVAGVRIPALLLQPLAENAVKHGVGARSGEGVVEIRARVDGEMLSLCVEDRTTGERVAPAESGTGTALATLRERLAKQLGPTAELVLEPTAEGMRAVCRLPVPGLAKSPEKQAA